jgi:hypothetical protein
MSWNVLENDLPSSCCLSKTEGIFLYNGGLQDTAKKFSCLSVFFSNNAGGLRVISFKEEPVCL